MRMKGKRPELLGVDVPVEIEFGGPHPVEVVVDGLGRVADRHAV